MPNLSDTITWRSRPQVCDVYLYLLKPEVVFAASVNKSPGFSINDYPVADIPFDTVTVGAYGDAKVGMTVKISSSSGVFKGYARIRKATQVGETVLHINHTPIGDIQFSDNDLLEVWDDYRIWAKVPYIAPDGTLYKDWDDAWTGETTTIPPVANGGPFVVRRLKGDSSIVVDFDGSASYAVADGASIVTPSWAFGDGDPASGLGYTVNGVEFPEGQRWVSFFVSDDNSQLHEHHIFVAAVEDDDPSLIPVSKASLNGSVEGGWTAQFELVGSDLDIGTFPDGTLAILLVEERYGGTAGSLNGYPDREAIKFVGWVTEHNLALDAETGTSTLTINADGPLARLQNLPGFSQVVERAASPSSWSEMAGADAWKYIHYLLMWHSTALDVCDLPRPSWYDDYPVIALESSVGSIYEQVNFIAKAVGAVFTSDKAGRLILDRHPMLMSSSEASANTSTLTVLESDWEALDWVERLVPEVGWIHGGAIVASTNDAQVVLAKAPGSSPGQGRGQQTLDRNLVTGQDELNTRLGRYYEWLNSRLPDLKLTIINMGGVVDPGWLEWIILSLDASSNVRGIGFSNAKLFLKAMSIRYDMQTGTSDEQWTLQAQSNDFWQAETEPLPSEDGTGLPDQTPPPWEPPPVIDPPGDDEEDETGVAISWGNPTAITFDRALGQWLILHNPAAEDTESVVGDEYTERYQTGSGDFGLYVLTSGGLYYGASALVTSPEFALKQELTGYHLARLVRGIEGGIAVYGKQAPPDGGDEYYVGAALPLVITGNSGWSNDFVVIPYSDDGIYGAVVVVESASAAGGQLKPMGAGTVGESRPGITTNSSINLLGHAIGTPIFLIPLAQRDAIQAAIGADWAGYYTYITNQTTKPITEEAVAVFQFGYNLGGAKYANLSIYPIYYGTPPDTDFTRLTFSSDYGDTLSTKSFAKALTGEGGYDNDDYNLGIHIAIGGNSANGSYVYYTYSDYTTTPLLIPDLAPSGSGVEYNLVRCPLRKQDGSRNNDATSFEFWLGSDALISGECLWVVDFDATTNTVNSQTNKTPTISTVDYIVKGPEALEVLGRDPLVVMGCFTPDGGGDDVLLLTTDGGTTWTIRNTADYEYIRWSWIGQNTVWLAGADGIAVSFNRGATLEDRTDNFNTDIADTAKGAFSVI